MHLFVKRASGASEAFSLVLKTNNCLRLRVLTRNVCLHPAYVSSPGVRFLNWRMRPQLAYVSSPGEYVFVSNKRACLSMSPPPSSSWVCTQKITYHPGFKSFKSLDGDCGMDRCHYAVPFKGISIRSTPEIVLSSKQN